MRRQESYITLPAAAAIGPYLRVHNVAGEATISGALDLDVGVTKDPAYAAGESIAIAPINATGTLVFEASVSITAGAAVYGAADGKVAVTANANPIGIAMHAAAAGQQIEVLVRWGLPTS